MKNSERIMASKISLIGMIATFFGLMAALGSVLLWLMFLFINPYSNAAISGLTYIIALTMCSLSVLGIFASLKTRLYLMYLVFLGSLPFGLYFLLTPGVFKWLGVLCMLYLVSAIVMTLNKANARPEPENKAD